MLSVNTHHEDGEHDLCYIERVPPVVIRYISVVPLDSDEEAVQSLEKATPSESLFVCLVICYVTVALWTDLGIERGQRPTLVTFSTFENKFEVGKYSLNLDDSEITKK